MFTFMLTIEMESHDNATVRRYAADLYEVECDDLTQLFSSIEDKLSEILLKEVQSRKA